MRIVGLTLINCLLILLTVLIHKVIYRMMLLNYENLFMYWGVFVSVFFVLNLLVNIVFSRKNIY
ncbi:bacteriocin-like WGxF protein [Massilibacterium senegalense]|uniref:bacteriocin-like WGxF protein n=1 Tax=Massilibacterium senegalense TaxID=1632858 RepID=UPI0007853BE9|nr:bacteriocin-like WGxF protein [Massilibacterium senegalense]